MENEFLEQLKAEAEASYSDMVELRRYFHEYPEISMMEAKTSKKIQKLLDAQGIAWKPIGNYGITGYLGAGEKTMALRADMDALAVTEKTNLAYASKNSGVMHACGHDVHMAALISALKILKKHEKELKNRIKFIFQPSEENAVGARALCEEGVMDDVDAIYGVHIFADLPAKKISIEEGPRMAITDYFKVSVYGKGGHAGKPHQCVDATVAAAAMVMSLQTIVSRRMDPVSSGVVSVGRLESGTAYNIISSESFFEGTIRSFSIEDSNQIKSSLKQIVEGIADAYGVSVEVICPEPKHPVVYNDPVLTKKALAQAKQIFAEEDFIHVPPMMLGEDFANYEIHAPGVFAFIGGGSKEKQCIYPNHHECFNIDEEALVNAALLYLTFASQS